MDLRDPALSRIARRAYEMGRLRKALEILVFTGAMAAIAFVGTTSVARTAVLAVALSAVSVALLWSGRQAGHGVVPGLLAGIFPLTVPLVVRTGGHCCIGGACLSTCVVACMVGGLAAGLLVGLWSAAETGRRPSFIAAALGIAALCGAMGCTFAGAFGLVGMALGLVAGSAPALLLARVRSS